MLACLYDNLSVVEYMLQHHAGSIDLNVRNNHGKTAKQIAKQDLNMGIIELLHRYKAPSRISSCSIS
jgi:ankyrin repeat protein